MIGGHIAALQAGLQMRWDDVRALEIVIEEIATEFGGEDPLRPLIRDALEKAKTGLTYLNRLLEVQDASAELKDPNEDYLADLKALVERSASNA